MNSLYQLLMILLSFYIGIFTFIGYEIIIPYQKKLIIMKVLAYFFFIAIIWIRIINKYNMSFNIIYVISYITGIVSAIPLLKKDIDSKIPQNINVLNLIYKLGNILLISPIFNYLRCQINKRKNIKKYPFLKPKTDKELF